jgi:hypothetical protein
MEMVAIQMVGTMEMDAALLSHVLSRLMEIETVKTQMDGVHIDHMLSRLTEMETEMVAIQTDVTMDAMPPNHGLFALTEMATAMDLIRMFATMEMAAELLNLAL